MNNRIFRRFLLLTTLILAACGQTPTPDPGLAMTQAFATVNAAYTQTALAVPTSTPTPSPTPYPTLPAPSLGTTLQNVTYCTNDNVPLKMDIYFPNAGKGPWPALLYVHGGTWMYGDKDKSLGLSDIPTMQNAGYLVANVDYRQAPEYPFPAMIIDVKCAVRFMRAHATELNIDPNHIGAWGSSAGGHLVSLLGLSDPSAGWDTGEYLNESSRIQAVVDMFGPTNLSDPAYSTRLLQVGYFLLFGTKDPNPDLLTSASPINFVTPDDPPFMIIQGDKDKIVDIGQSQSLYQRLQAAKVPATLVIVTNSGHNFEPSGGPISPTRDQIRQYMVAFFDYYLKPAK